MKKLVVTMVMVFGCASVVLAQGKGDVEFGLNVGYNSSSVYSSGDSSDTGSGFNVGAAADYYFSDRWSIKGKMIYDQKGWNNGFIEFENGTFTTNYNLDYLTVPVMANWHFGSKRNWYLNFGPYAGFLLSANETRFDTDVKEAFNTTDFGLALGIGVKIPVSDKVKIALEYDGQSGFSDIFKNNNGESLKNSRGSLNVGINFMMK